VKNRHKTHSQTNVTVVGNDKFKLFSASNLGLILPT
jgi:hypothetical protein